MCVDVSMRGYVHLSSGSHGSQRPWNCVELEFQAVVSHLMGVLGTEGGSSAGAVYALGL